MVFKTYLLVLCLEAIGIQCKQFCESPEIDSAITIKDSTFLFKGEDYWIWKHTTIPPHITPESKPIKEAFKAQFQIQGETGWHHLKQIDAIFSTDFPQSTGGVARPTVLYIFYQNEYYFLKIVEGVQNCSECSSCDSGMCFSKLSSDDEVLIPKNWVKDGGYLNGGFPEHINAAFPFKDYVILFHEKSARYVLKPNQNKSWPTQSDQKFNMSFERKIDDIFEISTGVLVMIDRNESCRFSINQLGENLNDQGELKITCDWKPNKYLFLCEKEPTTTTTPSIKTTTPTTQLTTSMSTESQAIQSTNNVIESISEESSFNVTELDTTETTEVIEKNDNKFWILFFVVMFLVLIFVITATAIGIAYCLSRKQMKDFTGAKIGNSNKMGNNSINLFDSQSVASVVTVDTLTGEAHNSNS